jgi:hypothetical protein
VLAFALTVVLVGCDDDDAVSATGLLNFVACLLDPLEAIPAVASLEVEEECSAILDTLDLVLAGSVEDAELRDEADDPKGLDIAPDE